MLAHDHASFRTWYADVLQHISWDFHDILDLRVTGTQLSGWAVAFFIHRVGEWHDQPLRDASPEPSRYLNRLVRANWRVEHDGQGFIIRRYKLTTAQTQLAW